ncbi:MAG: hypothetical protein ABFD79_06340 [Phycisphaerales bacterium]
MGQLFLKNNNSRFLRNKNDKKLSAFIFLTLYVGNFTGVFGGQQIKTILPDPNFKWWREARLGLKTDFENAEFAY